MVVHTKQIRGKYRFILILREKGERFKSERKKINE